MNLSLLSIGQLRHILSLVEKREAVQGELAEVEFKIAGLEKEKPKIEAKLPAKLLKKVVSVSAGKPSARGGGGSLKVKVLALLEEAGKDGLHVVDIAKKLKVKDGNLRVWFSTTGKKVKGVTRVSPGVYGVK
jgi:hypothetical protein